MAEQWASFGRDLHLRIDPQHGRRVGLELALREAVRLGRLSPGDRLPSSRALAQELGLARGTVTQVYEQLVAEGYLTARPRSGVLVAPRTGPAPGPVLPPAPALRQPVTGFDLRPGLPDLSTFPRREWLAATRQVLQSTPHSAFGYGDPTGCAELREALADYLGRARGVRTTPEHIIVCAGYTHALHIVSQTLRRTGSSIPSTESSVASSGSPIPATASSTALTGSSGAGAGSSILSVASPTASTTPSTASTGSSIPSVASPTASTAPSTASTGSSIPSVASSISSAGYSIAFENPTLPDYPALAAKAGLRVNRIAVDRDGLVVGDLTDEAAVVITPAHQFPLGVTLSPRRRMELLDWARRTGAVVLEDDYDGEFRYDRQPVGALQGLAPDQVVYAGTVSKTVAPALRIAWLVAPTGLVPAIRETLRFEETHVSVIDQLALAALIRRGDLDRHLRRSRTRYRRRRDHLGRAVADRLPGARLSGIAAGLHAVLRLPGTVEEEPALLEALSAHGVAVDGLSAFYHHRQEAPLGIVIGYATPPQHAYEQAISAMIEAVRSATGLPS